MRDLKLLYMPWVWTKINKIGSAYPLHRSVADEPFTSQAR